MENLLGRLARKTCLGDLVGHNYPAYISIYIFIYIYKYIYIYIYIYIHLGDLLVRLAWKLFSGDLLLSGDPLVCSTYF